MAVRRRQPTMDQDMGFMDNLDFANFDGTTDKATQMAFAAPEPEASPAPASGPAPLTDDELRQLEEFRNDGVFDNPIAGNKDTPRDVFTSDGPRGGPQGPGPGPGPEPSAAPDLSSIVQSLPQGVEAQGGGAVSAPMQSAEPQSVSINAQPPANASGGPPARQAPPSPVNLFSGGDQGSGLIGRGGGLFGGGVGMPGGQGGGPKPTKQMLALLEGLEDLEL